MRGTGLTTMFGLRYPIIQAPMANAAGGDLARESARGGGLGMIGTGTRASIPWLDEQWMRLEGVGPVGIGFMTWALEQMAEQRAMFRHALTRKPAAVLLSFGDPRPYAAAVRAAGARLICQVQTAAGAALALEAGADLLVAQGTEAGGHTGQLPLRTVLPDVLAMAERTPVVAAGGLATGEDVAAVLESGSCGAMLGTRFVATPESLYPGDAKERILRAGETDTVLTRVFDLVQQIPWPREYPGRALQNRFTEAWHGRESELQANLSHEKEVYEAARRSADYDTLVVYAGVAVGRIGEILPAAALMRQIGEEANTARRTGESVRR